tara:strand:+ start:2826 stop:3023 length:198 start_codon:yes stop_codon:yes gene_type:complete
MHIDSNGSAGSHDLPLDRFFDTARVSVSGSLAPAGRGNHAQGARKRAVACPTAPDFEIYVVPIVT